MDPLSQSKLIMTRSIKARTSSQKGHNITLHYTAFFNLVCKGSRNSIKGYFNIIDEMGDVQIVGRMNRIYRYNRQKSTGSENIFQVMDYNMVSYDFNENLNFIRSYKLVFT